MTVFYENGAELAVLTNTWSVDGTPTDPTTVSLIVTTPAGESTTYTYAAAEITRVSAGVFTKNIPCTEDGLWVYVWVGTGAASDVVAGTWRVFPVALNTVYAALEELKDARRIPQSDTNDDEALLAKLQRASRAIDRRCGRVFYAETTASARTFRTQGRTVREADGELLLVDDISSLTDLVVEIGDGSSWTTVTDVEYEPENALARGRAIEGIRRRLGYWRHHRQGRVTARWGWPAVPDDITEATLLLANRRFMRRDSPEGVAGRDTDGPIRVSRFDPDIEDLVGPYILPGFG